MGGRTTDGPHDGGPPDVGFGLLQRAEPFVRQLGKWWMVIKGRRDEEYNNPETHPVL